MAFSFRHDEPIPEGVRRTASSQVRRALRDLEGPGEGEVVAVVHAARRRCKRLRALARLVRPAIGGLYRPTDVAFRDAARELSDIRDSQVMVSTFDRLLASAPDGMVLPDLRTARRHLVDRHRAATEALESDPAPLEAARAHVEAGRSLIKSWDVPDDFGVLASGVDKTYSLARRRRLDCGVEPGPEALHEWRKPTAYHWFHLRLLRHSAPELIGTWARRVRDLTRVLGDDHDLYELVRAAIEAPSDFGGAASVDALTVLAEGRRVDLRSQALALGARVTAEQPDAVVDRLRCYWEAWIRFGPAPDGSLTACDATGEVATMTMAELRRRARTLQVDGRSRMSRTELERVLRAAGAG